MCRKKTIFSSGPRYETIVSLSVFSMTITEFTKLLFSVIPHYSIRLLFCNAAGIANAGIIKLNRFFLAFCPMLVLHR